MQPPTEQGRSAAAAGTLLARVRCSLNRLMDSRVPNLCVVGARVTSSRTPPCQPPRVALRPRLLAKRDQAGAGSARQPAVGQPCVRRTRQQLCAPESGRQAARAEPCTPQRAARAQSMCARATTHLLNRASSSASVARSGALLKNSCLLSSGPSPAGMNWRLRAKRTWGRRGGERGRAGGESAVAAPKRGRDGGAHLMCGARLCS